jgi:hypothetical protein
MHQVTHLKSFKQDQKFFIKAIRSGGLFFGGNFALSKAFIKKSFDPDPRFGAGASTDTHIKC